MSSSTNSTRSSSNIRTAAILANYKLNYGLPLNLELDVDVPYLAIFRAIGTPDAVGGGDTNLGMKWEFHKESRGSHVPALGASFYIEFPTGDSSPR